VYLWSHKEASTFISKVLEGSPELQQQIQYQLESTKNLMKPVEVLDNFRQASPIVGKLFTYRKMPGTSLPFNLFCGG